MPTVLPYVASFFMSIIACCALVCGSMMSWQVKILNDSIPSPPASAGSSRNQAAERDNNAISVSGAVLMPVFASVMLFSLFMFFSNVQLILLGYFLIVCLTTCTFAFRPLVARCLASIRQLCGSNCRPSSGCCGVDCLNNTVSTMLSCLLCLAWLLTGSWPVNNIIGFALCLTMIAALRVPSFKIACIALGGLLIYDVFWVFISPFIFQKNVMVEVAQQSADNPVHALAKALPVEVPESFLPPLHLEMPNKFTLPVYTWAEAGMTVVATQEVVQHTGLLQVGVTMLGLGDVALPGLLLALAYRFDRSRYSKRQQDAVTGAQAPTVERSAGVHSGEADEEEAPLLRSSSPPQDAQASDHTADPPLAGPASSGPGAAPAQMGFGGWLSACWTEVNFMFSEHCPLFRATMVAYAAGLLCTYVISYGFHAAQPALLYLVPFCLGTLAYAAQKQGVLAQLWAGNV